MIIGVDEFSKDKHLSFYLDKAIKAIVAGGLRRLELAVFYIEKEIEISIGRSPVIQEVKSDDPTNPAHYTTGKWEVIDFIEDKQLGFHLGNSVKYICRAGKKDASKYVEDLRKSVWYLDREIKKQKGDM